MTDKHLQKTLSTASRTLYKAERLLTWLSSVVHLLRSIVLYASEIIDARIPRING